MKRTVFEDEAMWRYHVLIGLVLVRQVICELTFVVGLLFLTYMLASRWPDLPLYAAAAMICGAVMGYWRASRTLKWLEQQPIHGD